MLSDKQIMLKLNKLPEMFRWHISRKDYYRAKACYDTARTIAVFMEADEGTMCELFGERGERGEIVKQGLFPEEQVQRVYLECIKRNQTHENKSYSEIQRML